MSKRASPTSWTTVTDQDASFLDPASERSADMMLSTFKSHPQDAEFDPMTLVADGHASSSDEAAFAPTGTPVRSGHSSSDFPAVFSLADLDGTNGFRLSGVDRGDFSGYSVASAGDVNADGIDDVIIGAPISDTYAGESYVVFGSRTGFAANLNLSTLDGTNGFRIDGVDAYDRSGWSVSSAGDVNGDGFDDVIIGAFYAGPGGDSKAGESYVVFGKAGGHGGSIDLATLDGRNGFRLDGINAGDFSGVSVASAGDINADGLDDLIIGAPYADLQDIEFPGASYVVFGSSAGFDASLDLSSLDGSNGFRIDGAHIYDASGYSVASAGDVNGDGFDDVIVGTTNAGASYVVFGSGEGFAASFDLGALDGTNGFRIDGVDLYDRSGRSVASAGDVNGDGFDDVIIGAFGGDPSGKDYAGESYVVFGKADGHGGEIDLSTLDGANGFRIDGANVYDGSGSSVASAGDVNGDGFDDLLIGAPFRSIYSSSDSDAGETYVVFGRAGGHGGEIDLSTIDGTNGFRIDGTDPTDRSGASVSSAGDVNDDGFDDIIIGAIFADPNGVSSAGESYIVYGSAPTKAVTRIGSAADQTIRGGDFNDTLKGEGGNDKLGGGGGADTLNGGIGKDWAYYDTADADVRASLNRPGINTGEAAGDRYISIENLRGTRFDDRLTGDSHGNRLRGDDGADTLSGRGGGDTLIGGGGHDGLEGGTGADSFQFASLSSADSDTISDFTGGVDKIALDDNVFGFAEGALPPDSFFVGGAARDADDRVIYNNATGQLFFDADGFGGGSQVLIATLDGAPTLAATDIVVV